MGDALVVVARSLASVAFAWAGAVKITRSTRWRVDLRVYRLPRVLRAITFLILPWAELAVAAGLLLGASSAAAWVALMLLATFSLVIVRARMITGTARLACGCFGGTSARDYRLLLARNAVLAVVAIVGMLGDQEPVFGSRAMGTSGVLPTALVLLSALAVGWMLWQASIYVRAGTDPAAPS